MKAGAEPPLLPRGERRSVTVLFADLSNFTGLGERLDAEELTALVHACFVELVEEVETRGGWLDKQSGDALFAVFGAPVAHEDDPVRAVETALAMLERVRAMSERLHERIGAPLDLHIGINTGLAVVAPAVGRQARGDEFMALGDAVTTAARLQQAARTGEILVGRTTYRATERQFEYRPLAPLRLKGKQDRVPAWACVGRRIAAERSPLVGRTREAAVFDQCFSDLENGHGGLVIVAGEPGVGKTRLLDHARRAATERGLRWAEGATASFGETAAYAPVAAALKDLAGIAGEEDGSAALRGLADTIHAVFAPEEAREVLPYLTALLSLEVPDEYAESLRFLDAEGVGLQIFRSVRRFVERTAAAQPLVVVFEDWHWADESSAALVEHLVPLCRSSAILICCSTRLMRGHPAALRRHAALTLDDRIVDVDLRPLEAADADALISNLVTSIDVRPHVRERIIATTEGNPFFIEALISSLVDADDRERVEIPDTLRGAIIARVDRLPVEQRETLTRASVLGRTFTYAQLLDLVDAEGVDELLDELVDADFLQELPSPYGREFAFRHAVTHEVVYESALLAHRRELHLQVARSLENALPERVDELAGTVAFHYAQAEDWERAQEYLFRAGDHAATVAGSSEALAYYGKAVEAYSRVFGSEWRDRQRAELDRKIGEALFRRAEHAQAAEYLEHALGCLGFAYPKTRTRLQAAIVRAAAEQAIHRFIPLPRYRAIHDDPDPWMDELSRIFDTLGWIYFFSDPARIVLDSFRQLNEAERHGFRLAMVRASTGLGFVFDAIPLRRLAGAYHRRSVALASELENPRSVGIAHLGLAHHQRYQLGTLQDALLNYERAAAECRRAGDIRGGMGATLMLAEVTSLTGDVGRSLEHGRLILEIGEEAGDAQVIGWGHHALGRTLRVAGAPDAARRHLEQGYEVSAGVPDYQALVVAGGNLGLSMLSDGDGDAARAVLERTWGVAVEEHALRSFACTHMLEGLATASLAEAEAADDERRAALLREAGEACSRLRRQVRLDRAAAPALLRLQGTYRWLRGDRRRAAAMWRRSMSAAESLGLTHELALVQVEVGSRLGEQAIGASGHALLGELAARAESSTLEVPAPLPR